LLAYLVVAENPLRTAPVKELLEAMQVQRSQSRHILDQISLVERFRLELWILRAGGQVEASPSQEIAP